MLRKTLTILSLIGLLLSVVAWRVSYFGPVFCTHHYALQLTNGLVGGFRSANRYSANRRWKIHRSKGSETYWLPFIKSGRTRGVGIPLWMLCLMFAALPAYNSTLSQSYRRRKHKKLGLCLKCGYDLRASKDRCPECGEEFETT